jgi:hypothetical protein
MQKKAGISDIDVTSAGALTNSTCCESITCANNNGTVGHSAAYSCPANHTQLSANCTAQTNKCTLMECCFRTCASVSCGANKHKKAGISSTNVTGSSDAINACCESVTCANNNGSVGHSAAYSCPANHTALTAACTNHTNKCVDSDCCTPTCAFFFSSFACPAGSISKSTPNDINCTADPCTQQADHSICCDQRKSCDQYNHCPQYKVPNPSNNCTGVNCTDSVAWGSESRFN